MTPRIDLIARQTIRVSGLKKPLLERGFFMPKYAHSCQFEPVLS
jgi:hypothetical protein